MQYIPQNYNVSFTFNSLNQNQTYSLFYFATVDDPTLTALSTAVTAINVTTLTATQININHQGRLAIFVLLTALVLMVI